MKKILLTLVLSLIVIGSFSQSAIRGFPRHRNVMFEGNSLSDFSSNSTLAHQFYVPINVFNGVTGTYHPLVFSCFAISGRTQTQINASITTNISPIAKRNDVIIDWEGTNDLYTNALSAADAYTNLLTYISTVKGYGAVVIVGTVLARDYVSDPADLMTRVDSYNSLVRSGASTYGYTVCDLAADPLFDTRADASNTTYYNADKIHQTTAGQDRVITLMTATLSTVLASLAKEEIPTPYNSDSNDWDRVFVIISILGAGYYATRKAIEEPEYKIAA
jgi:hypothetical protein